MAASDSKLARRLFSLSGVLPLGVFLVVHLATNVRAIRGGGEYARAIDLVHRIPGLPAVEALLLFAPLALHSLVGSWLAITRTPLSEPSPYGRTMSIAVRATGAAALAFIAMHLAELRFGARLDGATLATIVQADLSSTRWSVPWRALAYLVGTACVTFHFAAGLWGWFARTRRGESSARARRFAAWGAGAVGAAMWILFADVVVLHATGARLLGSPTPETNVLEQCPPN